MRGWHVVLHVRVLHMHILIVIIRNYHWHILRLQLGLDLVVVLNGTTLILISVLIDSLILLGILPNVLIVLSSLIKAQNFLVLYLVRSRFEEVPLTLHTVVTI